MVYGRPQQRPPTNAFDFFLLGKRKETFSVENREYVDYFTTYFYPADYVPEEALNFLLNPLRLALHTLPGETWRPDTVFKWMISHGAFHVCDSAATNHPVCSFTQLVAEAVKLVIVVNHTPNLMQNIVQETFNMDRWAPLSRQGLSRQRDALQAAFQPPLPLVTDVGQNRLQRQSEDAEEIDQLLKTIITLEDRAEKGEYDLPLKTHDIHREMMVQGRFLPGDKGEWLERTLRLAAERDLITVTGKFVELNCGLPRKDSRGAKRPRVTTEV